MSDVEKYGLFAVVFVGGLLLVIGLQGGFSSTPDVAPVIIGGELPSAASPSSDEAALTAGNRVRVKPIMPTTAFDWGEGGIAYPGERASTQPSTLEEPASLRVVVPAGAPAVVAAPSGLHTVASGETLSTIAARYLGNESRWKELVKLNPGLDPRKLKIGMQIRVSGDSQSVAAAPASKPDAGSAPASTLVAPPGAGSAKPVAATPTASVSGRTHTVVKGDTLGAIAKKYLGSATRADDLYAANKDVLKSKDALKLGQVLRIP